MHAVRTPDAIAVSAGATRLTYRELDRRANQLAHRLVALGVGLEVPVPVLMERSIELVIATLAVLKAGGCYLPVHDAFPPARKQWVVDQAAAPMLLIDEVMRARGVPEHEQVLVVANEPSAEPVYAPDEPGAPGHAAYLMYTSGSTGQPKGVLVPHRAVLGLVADRGWNSGAYQRVLMLAPYAFSVSTFELWVPLLRGGTIVLAPPGALEVSTLRRLLATERITAVHVTAGLFRVVAEEAPESFAGVREVLVGGDVIAPAAVRQVLAACPGTVVRAMYGATETSLFSASQPLTRADELGTRIPAGRPLDGVLAYVLDEWLRPVEPGVDGELYIGGPRLARGYFGRPDLTAAQFVADPFAGLGARMYRTGDLVRRGGDGVIDFVGRATDQVKVRGFLVEPAEVSAAMAAVPGVTQATVVAREIEPGEKRLVGYVVADGVGMPAIRDHLGETLPDYMVPNAIVVLDKLPLTPNGKVDYQALPEPDFTTTSIYQTPDTPRQWQLCSMFAEVLGMTEVGMGESFFELGGQSLLAMRLINRIQVALGVNVTLKQLFDAPTVAELDSQLPVDTRPGEKAGRGR